MIEYKDTHLNNECNELFSNLNNDSLSSDNLKRISLLLDNNANIQQYAEGLLSLEKNELTQELFTKFPNEAKQLNDILSKVKEKHPFLVEKELSSALTDDSIDKKAEVFLEKFVLDFEKKQNYNISNVDDANNALCQEYIDLTKEEKAVESEAPLNEKTLEEQKETNTQKSNTRKQR